MGDRYATALTGVRLDLVEAGRACCSLDLEAAHRNAMGAVMGGVMFTLADLAFAAAANAQDIEAGNPLSWVSLGSTIHYLAQPRGARLIAVTCCVRQGRTTCVFNIHIHDENNTPVALVTTTGMKIKQTL